MVPETMPCPKKSQRLPPSGMFQLESITGDEMREFPIGRTLSLIVAAVYLAITGIYASSQGKLLTDLLIIGAALLFPLACIWFPDELGEYMGALPAPGITRKSPGWMVRIGGWVLLLLPAIVFWFIYREG